MTYAEKAITYTDKTRSKPHGLSLLAMLVPADRMCGRWGLGIGASGRKWFLPDNAQANSNDIEVNLTPNSDGSQSRVCIVANTGDENWAKNDDGTTAEGFKAYDSFLQQAIPAEAAEPFLSSDIGSSAENGRAIPMSGTSKAMAITTKCYVSVPLYRMFARVNVEVVDPSRVQQLGMTIEKLSFSNIPAYCRVGTLSDRQQTQKAFPNMPLPFTYWYPMEKGKNILTPFIPARIPQKTLMSSAIISIM